MGLKLLCKILFSISILILFPLFVFSDYNVREDKQNQIDIYQSEIIELKNKMTANDSLIAKLKNDLDYFNTQVTMTAELLNDVKMDTLKDSDKLIIQEAEISNISDKINSLKENLKKKLIWMYKYGASYNYQLILSSRSLKQFYTRLVFLNKFSESKIKELEGIKNNRFTYITDKKNAQTFFISQKYKTEFKIKALDMDNESISRQISNKNEKINELQKYLNESGNNFIIKIDQKVDYESVPFSQLEGRLINPVNSINILKDYGVYVNSETLTLNFNNGVDVSISKGSDIKCVARGIVQEIRFIPTLGNVIIIDHGDNFYTVYGVTDNIKVTEGSKVYAGEIIAKTSENFNGQSFHFELWSGNNPLDPKQWVKR
jgi:septal ring factor EnvC (AmiA/AmiB activator)